MATILAIDDEHTCLEVIEFSLKTKGHKVLSAMNGMEGIGILSKNFKEIDLILLDMMMPQMSGIDTLEEIRKLKLSKNIPVIVQTGTSNYEEIKKALKLGAIKYIIRKPYTRKDLILIIEQALQGKIASNDDSEISFIDITQKGSIEKIQ